MLEKHYDHQAIESRWYPAWEENKLFSSKVDPTKKPFTVVIPPPNVTGMLHMGHVLNNTIQDILIRYKKMNGFNTCWVPGMDHAGIATQTMVEKNMRKQGIDPDSLTREEFLEKVWNWKHDFGGLIIRQLRRLGSSCDWDRERFTMDEGLSNAVLTMFKHLYDKGWIYRGKYIVNWCPALQTALSDDEVERSEEDSSLWHFKYPLVEGDGHLVVATTRPETMLGDTGVAVHPDDERYKHLIGKKLLLPIVNREIPIIAHTHVDPAFGTGCVKVTPSHSKEDFEMAMDTNLEFLTVMDKRAIMNENAPEAFRGMDRFKARKAVVAKMEELGFLLKTEPHKVAVGRCYRTKDVVEPYLSEQWFIKMEHMAKRALDVVLDGKIKLHPERWVNVYRHWLENIRDWCISRQLKWGHRIPVWYCGDCGAQTCSVELAEACGTCGSKNIEQDPDVMDTWASSWLWPFSVFGWPEKSEDLAYYYPTSTLVTAADIIFFWVARMVMSGLEALDEIPFDQVYFNGIVRDLQGRKMSKTLGNSPNPLDVIDKYGADALRFSVVYNTPYGEDTRFAEASCDLGRGFCTKIWNANRFLQMTFEGVTPDDNWREAEGDIVARWILSRLHSTIDGITEELENFRLANAASRIYNFFWSELCDWYVEFLKPLQREADEAGRAVMLGRTQAVIDTCLRMLHPFMPFVTEELWHHLDDRHEGRYLVQQDWPKLNRDLIDTEIEDAMSAIQALISGTRAVRKSYNLPNNAHFHLYLYAAPSQIRYIEEMKPILLKLAGLEDYTVLEENAAPQGCTAINVKGMSAYLDLRGHLDIEAELGKIDAKIAKINKEMKPLEGRLKNKGFVDKAPAEVVDKARADLEELKRQVDTLSQTREDLQKLGQA
ncbi:Valine--tRNA ligase [Sulfidibacter corallicola]|uniref:Valine--tRNA ligase n=1 Tax=Sulfidibacter corallicola TaxID=2818388 RepID=A0A8A4TSS3_SULCO|nr:valine--tRNA ligase [Sulfidibacter corallicola]QTD52102.1 valine--tRNA ligase [Sulfidibacter corallicola]